MLRIIVMNGSKAGTRRDLPEGKMHLIGRTGGILPLNDRLASRVHAEFSVVNGDWYVTDMCSKNGTFLNGLRTVGRSLIRNGDQLQIGKTKILIALTQTVRKCKIGHLPMVSTPPRKKIGTLRKSA